MDFAQAITVRQKVGDKPIEKIKLPAKYVPKAHFDYLMRKYNDLIKAYNELSSRKAV